MKKIRKIGIAICALLILAFAYLNHRYEVVALHLFAGSDDADLKVMTWNVHCSEGTDIIRQKELAEVILKEDADIVLLNEIHQDSCLVLDSMLRTKYAYTEEYQSHRKAGDIFYAKREMSNSGHPILREIWESHYAKEGEYYPDTLKGKSIQAIKATITIGRDSVMILGCHWSSNRGEKKKIAIIAEDPMNMDSLYVSYQRAQISRSFQSQWTAELINNSKHPVIIMGDMNDFSYSEPLRILTDIGLKDAWWEGGTGYGCTFHSRWMRLRIDHIFHSEKLKLTDVRVIDTGNLSDHHPLTASFKIVKQ